MSLERPDAELVEAACRGDVASFRDLYVRHYRMAVGIAYSRLSDAHLAEDAAQEAFATACRQLASLRDPSRFPEWLGTICRRKASQLARAQTNHASLESVSTAKEAEDSPREIMARVRNAVDSLPASAREVVMLRYFSGLSYEQIALALGISQQSVHGRLQRARVTLARELAVDDK